MGKYFNRQNHRLLAGTVQTQRLLADKRFRVTGKSRVLETKAEVSRCDNQASALGRLGSKAILKPNSLT